MKIAITSTGPTLEDRVEPFFKRCAFFLVLDRDRNTFESIFNPNIALGGIAGEKSALLIPEAVFGVKLTLPAELIHVSYTCITDSERAIAIS
jgi:hypothetical protein